MVSVCKKVLQTHSTILSRLITHYIACCVHTLYPPVMHRAVAFPYIFSIHLVILLWPWGLPEALHVFSVCCTVPALFLFLSHIHWQTGRLQSSHRGKHFSTTSSSCSSYEGGVSIPMYTQTHKFTQSPHALPWRLHASISLRYITPLPNPHNEKLWQELWPPSL